jgi:hypothetical protein
MPFNINYAKYRFGLTIVEAMNLPPYKGSLFRGELGRSLKNLCCVQNSKLSADCSICMFRESCPYSFLFEIPSDMFPGNSAMHRHMPPPFLIESVDIGTEYQPGTNFVLLSCYLAW